MLKIVFTGQFKKDYKTALKRGCDPEELKTVISLLAMQQPLPEKYRDHALESSRNYQGMRECHVKPDWLLIYRIFADKLTLELIRTGSHSDLF